MLSSADSTLKLQVEVLDFSTLSLDFIFVKVLNAFHVFFNDNGSVQLVFKRRLILGKYSRESVVNLRPRFVMVGVLVLGKQSIQVVADSDLDVKTNDFLYVDFKHIDA